MILTFSKILQDNNGCKEQARESSCTNACCVLVDRKQTNDWMAATKKKVVLISKCPKCVLQAHLPIVSCGRIQPRRPANPGVSWARPFPKLPRKSKKLCSTLRCLLRLRALERLLQRSGQETHHTLLQRVFLQSPCLHLQRPA